MLSKLIEEILELKNDRSHRAALRIYSILDDNRNLFIRKIDKDMYNQLLVGFQGLAYFNPGQYNSDAFRSEFSRYYESLSYYISKVIA